MEYDFQKYFWQLGDSWMGPGAGTAAWRHKTLCSVHILLYPRLQQFAWKAGYEVSIKERSRKVGICWFQNTSLAA